MEKTGKCRAFRFSSKRNNCTSMVVTYYVKLFRIGTDRHNGILMSLLLLVTETIDNHQFCWFPSYGISVRTFLQNMNEKYISFYKENSFLSKSDLRSCRMQFMTASVNYQTISDFILGYMLFAQLPPILISTEDELSG